MVDIPIIPWYSNWCKGCEIYDFCEFKFSPKDLDVLARRELWRVIEGLKGRVTIILTTHYLEEAQALSDRIGIMAKGRLTAVGTVGELLAETGETSLEDAFVSICGEGGRTQ